MSDIYELHAKAFGTVSAYVITRGGERVATVAFKFPPAGHAERRLWCYIHIIGVPMVRGYADGYGYCKTDAAFHAAARKLGSGGTDTLGELISAVQGYPDRGVHWGSHLIDAGYDILQAL